MVKNERTRPTRSDPRLTPGEIPGLLELAPEAAAVLALPEGRYVDVNADFERLTGRTRVTIVGRTPADLGFSADDRNGSDEHGTRLTLPDGELTLRRLDGSVRHALASSRLVACGGRRLAVHLLRDVTERFERDREIREREARYRSLFGGVPVGLYRTNPEGRFLEVNPVLVEMLGYPDTEALQSVNVLRVYGEPEARDRLRKALEADGRVRNYELMLRRQDGSTLWAELEARVLRDGRGAVLGYEGVVVDITERKLAEGRRRDLVAMLTHDIKNPLASIIAFVDYLRGNGSNVAERKGALDRIEASAREALALAKNLLDADRIERCGLPLQRQRTSLNSVVDEAIRNQASLARVYGVELETVLEPALPLLDIDPHLVGRVVVNLVANAIRFAPQGTKVTVETRRDGERVRLTVRDRGPGIPEEERKDLFERFRPLSHSQRDSTGLGLFIVRMVTEAHGGEVAVECPDDGGAAFRIVLPAR